MGNNGSRIGNITQRVPEPNEEWSHSFPRNSANVYQHKVLPDRKFEKPLRTTNNGEILQAGGTISGRHYPLLSLKENEKPFRIFRTNSISPAVSLECHQGEKKSYLPPRGAQRYAAQRHENKSREHVKRFGSAPDLRNANVVCRDEKEKFRAKKKYRAPPPPKVNRSNGYCHCNEELQMEPLRRVRLFKTKTEGAHKSYIKNDSPLNKYGKMEHAPSPEIKNHDSRKWDESRKNGIPEFQAELKEAIQRIKSTKNDEDNSKTLDFKIKKGDVVTCSNASGKTNLEVKEEPAKFYFGMDEVPAKTEKERDAENNVLLNLAVTLEPFRKFSNSSASDISSEFEVDDSQVSNNGIALQLRPILPKKQLEIPRFSPAVAWKLLSAVEPNFTSSTSDENPFLFEDRIEKFSRPLPPPVVQAGPRSSYDKSGDSGISGDAGPTPFDDSPEDGDVRGQLPLILNTLHATSWTPQQDLEEEESSTEEEMPYNRRQHSANLLKFSPNPNAFSLSLPRDNQLSLYMNNKTSQQYMGLQKLKQSMSGVLGNLAVKKDVAGNTANNQSDNWFFSKSAPNSLNNGFNSLDLQHSQKVNDDKANTNMTRVMYLPEYKQSYKKRQDRSRNEEKRKRSKSVESKYKNDKTKFMSRSCENIFQIQSSPEPEDLQDPPEHHENMKIYKPKRFTFQSTIRQIERRRLAERLSREAEKKERQRLSELEAMQRVEEEFQMKRAREKATIRHQLQLFSLDEAQWSSLPPFLELKTEASIRPEPDGAASSTSSTDPMKGESMFKRHTQKSDSEEIAKTPATQILSEYRQSQREYKDFRGSLIYRGEPDNYIKQTVYPQVTCNMPKASEHQGIEGNNYRKQFAHGVRNRSGGSTHSEESQNNKSYSPKIYRSKNVLVSRF